MEQLKEAIAVELSHAPIQTSKLSSREPLSPKDFLTSSPFVYIVLALVEKPTIHIEVVVPIEEEVIKVAKTPAPIDQRTT